MNVKRPAWPLLWKLHGSQEGGWGICLVDDVEEVEILMCPDDPGPLDWATPEEAREAVAAELRRLADVIERGETP